jgi:hypothetical protein
MMMLMKEKTFFAGTLMLIYITIWINISPEQIPLPPDAQFGNFDNAAFLGPLVGGVPHKLAYKTLLGYKTPPTYKTRFFSII